MDFIDEIGTQALKISNRIKVYNASNMAEQQRLLNEMKDASSVIGKLVDIALIKNTKG